MRQDKIAYSECFNQDALNCIMNLHNASDVPLYTRLSIEMKGVVSKENVVLRRWGCSIQKFSFINEVDNVNWPPYRDSKS